jgi:hypothetical protein
VANKVHHWKHGWIPLDAFARAELARRNGGPLLHALKSDGGFTYNPKKGHLVKVGSVDGVAVARPGTEQIVGRGDVSREDFANAVADVIEKHGDHFSKGAMLGGWYSEDRDVYMVEITDVFPDRASAVKAGRERNQEGVFDLKTGDFIDTGGTGDQHPQLALQSAILPHPLVDPIPNVDSSFSAAADTTEQLIAPSTGPGQKFWPAGVPAIKDVGVFNAADGARLADAYAASGKLLDGYTKMEPQVTPKLVSIAAANGGYMMGLANKLKTRDSLTRKLYSKSKDKGLTPEQYGAKLGDALRYTMIAPPEGLTNGTQSVLDSFRKRGYRVEVENTWGVPGATYKGINTNIIAPDGRIFEVQFHTEQSFTAKDAQHPLYDIARSTSSTVEERAAANAQMQANMAALTVPPGIEKIR